MDYTPEFFDKVIAAILCSFDPKTPNDEKRNALKFLDDLKENQPTLCSTLAFELLKQTNDQAILHHHSLNLLESTIKYKWNVLKLDERNLIKKQLFVIIKSTCLTRIFMGPIHIRNSLAKCLVETIKRDCFDKFNTTLDELVNIIQEITQIQESNVTQLELILLVLRFLNEDITIYAHTIQAQRRRQILNQLQKRLSDILLCLVRISNDLLTSSEQQERLAQACLLCVNSFLTWIEYNHIEQYELFLYELFLKFFQLNSVKLRHASFECLLSLVNKRLARRQLQQQQQQRNKRIASAPSSALNCQQEKLFLNYFLSDKTLEMFCQLLISPTNSVEQLRVIVTNDHINCLKMLGQLLVKLSNYLLQLFQQLTTKAIDDNDFLTFVNERTYSFLQFLLLLNQHPFHQLSLNSYQALNLFIMKQTSLLSNEQFCLKFIFNLKQSLHRIHFSSSASIDNENDLLKTQYMHNQQCFIYALSEYDSEEQFFWKFFSQYRSELQKLMKSFISLFFTEHVPDISPNMNCLRSILENLLAYLKSLVQRTPNKASSTAVTSVYVIIEWEAFYLLFDHVLFIIRQELFSTTKFQDQYQSLLLTSTLKEQFLHTLNFLVQFTPNLSEHIHGHVLNLLASMFFITEHDQTLAIQLIQRLLSTFQLYQQQSIAGADKNQCETMQTQSSNAFLYLCKNFTNKIIDYYAELFPFLCQLYKNEFQITKTSLPITVDELSSPTLKLLDCMQILLCYKLINMKPIENHQVEDFYEFVKPIYEVLNVSLKFDTLPMFIDYLDLCSNRYESMNIIRYRRRSLMLALHCLCLLLRYWKQQLDMNLHSIISLCLRPILFDYVVKVTQFCNQLYDRQLNPLYDLLKLNLAYSDTERQLYLGTYESNNVAKATIPSTCFAPSSPTVSYVRLQSTSNMMVDDERLRDYLHRLFDICYQINGMYFAYDIELYYLKLNDNNYFFTTYLQKVLFENLNTLPSFRLRIVLRQFCRLFVENYSSSNGIDREIIDELFLKFLDALLPYIQQRLTTMWNNLLTTSVNYQQGECSDEVIEECVCVLITRDFVDIIRYFIYKTIPGQTNSTSSNINKKKNKTNMGRQNSESMCDEINGDSEQIDEWDEQNSNSNITNKLLNNFYEKSDYSDLFMYLVKLARQNSFMALQLFNNLIRILFECLTFPDAYCVNRFLPIVLPIAKLYMDIMDKHVNSASSFDAKFLFQCLIKALERHNENESLNTNIISLIGHIYELWHNQYQSQLDRVLHEAVPQMNTELLNTYKTRLCAIHDSTAKKAQQPISERERRDTIKNLLNPILLSPVSSRTRIGLNSTNPFQV